MLKFMKRWLYDEVEVLGTTSGLAWVLSFFVGGWAFGSIVTLPSIILGVIMMASLGILFIRAAVGDGT